MLLVTLASIGSVRARPVVQLVNPGFEGGLVTPADDCYLWNGEKQGYSGAGPEGWTPYFRCKLQTDGDGINDGPEYTTIARWERGYRVRNGDSALKYFTFARVQQSAGVYQRVAVTNGQWLHFSAWVQLWTSDCLDPHLADDTPPTSFLEPGNLEVRVCVDTDGGALDWDAGTRCSNWVREGAWDRYTQIGVAAQAQADEVLVAINSRNEWRVRFNDVYVDDAELTVMQIPSTSVPMTNTVFAPFAVHEGWLWPPTWPRGPDEWCGWPTPAPSATETPAPSATETPAPSATETPAPSATETPAPSATETPAPSATETPAPSATETPAPGGPPTLQPRYTFDRSSRIKESAVRP